MSDTFSVSGRYNLETNAPQVLERISLGFREATQWGRELRETLDHLGGASSERVETLLRSLRSASEISMAPLARDARTAAASFDELAASARRAQEAMQQTTGASFRPNGHGSEGWGPPGPTSGGAEDGRHGGHSWTRSPWRADIPGLPSGGMVGFSLSAIPGFELAKSSFNSYAATEQVYTNMMADSRVRNDPAVMATIRGSADESLHKYRVLTPQSAALNAAEAYSLSGGVKTEQRGITDILGRLESNMILRSKNAEDAQRQATSIVRGMDVSNQFYDPKTGEFDERRASHRADLMQAMVSAGNGLISGDSIQRFFRSAGTMGQSLSEEGAARMTHFIEVNPNNAANNLKSFVNLFEGQGTRMRPKDMGFWRERGIYGRDGRLVDDNLLHSDPILWVEKHLRGMSAEEISSHMQRMNVSSIVNETEGSAANINRQAAAVARSDANANAENMLNSPTGHVHVLEASMSRFQATLGRFEAGPGVKILDGLTRSLDHVTTYMNAHPGDMERFGRDVNFITSAISHLVHGISSVLSYLPAPLRSMLVGAGTGAAAASVVPVIGTGAGAVTGALAGAADYYTNTPDSWLFHPLNAYRHWRDGDATRAIQPPPVVNLAPPSGTAPSLESMTNRQGDTHTYGAGTPVVVNLNVDGRSMAQVTLPHLEDMQRRQAQQDMRSSGTAPDVVQYPQVPGRAITR